MAISNRHSSLGRPHLIITENQFLIHCMEKGTENSSKSWITIQRTDRKLWPFRPVHQAWLDQTSTSPRIDSSCAAWKRASKNSSKHFIAIQQSDQKLWPFRPVHPAWLDQSSSSPRIHSSSTPWNRASGNSSKSLSAIPRSEQKLRPFRTVHLACYDHTSSSPRIDSSSTAWKRASKTPVKVGSPSNGGTKVMALSARPSSLARPDLNITENRFLIRCMEKGIRKL